MKLRNTKNLSSARWRLIAINHIQNKSFCVHNMCVCVLCICIMYIYKYTHPCIYLRIMLCLYVSAVKQLITSKINVFVCIIYVYVLYIYYVYIKTHTFRIYFENMYMYIYILIFYIIYKYIYIFYLNIYSTTHTHTHTHTHVVFYGLRGLSIGVMVFILYKLYVLLPYTYPTPKLSPHRRRCISIFPSKKLTLYDL